MDKNINNIRGEFIVDYRSRIILLLALILCYFGLFAGWLRFILSWEVKFLNLAFLFVENLIDLYFVILLFYNVVFVIKNNFINDLKFNWNENEY